MTDFFRIFLVVFTALSAWQLIRNTWNGDGAFIHAVITVAGFLAIIAVLFAQHGW